MLLKNIDEDVNLIDKPAENSPSTARLPTVTKVKDYIDNDNNYDKRAKSWHKKEIVLELKNIFSSQTEASELLQSLKKSSFLA